MCDGSKTLAFSAASVRDALEELGAVAFSAKSLARLVLVNLVLRAAGEDLFFAPRRHIAEGLALDERSEGGLFRHKK